MPEICSAKLSTSSEISCNFGGSGKFGFISSCAFSLLRTIAVSVNCSDRHIWLYTTRHGNNEQTTTKILPKLVSINLQILESNTESM